MRPIPNYGEHMTIAEFVRCVKTGAFIDYDGTGYLATKDKITDLKILPSDIAGGIHLVTKCTHVVWFNK